MLIRLQIQNFALIQNLTLEFDARLNVLTGETGAGKSILIDAICFALGGRFEGLKSAAGKTCSVEAVFEISKTLRSHEVLSQFISEEDDVLILRREVTAEGRGRVWINNKTATAGALKQAGELMLDIHGQHDHQLLLDPACHLDFIDRLAKNSEILASYGKVYSQYAKLLNDREEIRSLQDKREREIDLLKYQIEEIEGPEFEEDEEDELNHERIRLANAEKLHGVAGRILQLLNDDDPSVSGLLGQAARDFNSFVKIDPSMGTLKGEYETAQLNLEEIIRTLKTYQENLSFDEDRLNEIDKRMDQIDLVKRKYGGSLSKVLEYLAEAKTQYDKLLNSGLYEKEIERGISKLMPELKEFSSQLTERRKKAGASLKKTIEAELKDLNIPSAIFECSVTKKDFSPTGADALEFLVSLNPGHEPSPLARIISGGEASRVMLAMKKALMKVDPMPTLIFDEIDANIGGRLGQVTGQKLKEISEERQVLLITHLPQIASFADRHFKVSKKAVKGQTLVEYELLEGEARVRELAQMMSGKNETEISRKHAEEMISRSR